MPSEAVVHTSGNGEITDSERPGGQGQLGGLQGVLFAPLAAVAFLTVIPVPLPSRPVSVGWTVGCFSLVGTGIGVALAGVDRLLAPWLPASVTAALLLAMLLLLTGGIHLDGLMDSFDGLFGGRDAAGRIAIMRDSRVGSYGVAAGICVLLIEYGCLAALATEGRAVALVLAGALSRGSMALVLWGFPAAGSGGLAAGLKPSVRWPHAGLAAALAIAVSVAMAGVVGLGATALAGALALMAGRYVVARIGGITGDGCGAVGLIVEAATLVAWVAAAARMP